MHHCLDSNTFIMMLPRPSEERAKNKGDATLAHQITVSRTNQNWVKIQQTELSDHPLKPFYFQFLFPNCLVPFLFIFFFRFSTFTDSFFLKCDFSFPFIRTKSLVSHFLQHLMLLALLLLLLLLLSCLKFQNQQQKDSGSKSGVSILTDPLTLFPCFDYIQIILGKNSSRPVFAVFLQYTLLCLQLFHIDDA